MSKPTVICISGKAGAGKDLAATYFAKHLSKAGQKVKITHYADLLKYVCRTYLDWNGEKDSYGRSLLQYVGTDVVREKDPNYWVNFLADILDFFGHMWDCVIIPDTRFPNELERLRERGYDPIHIRVMRDTGESKLSEHQQNHPSETALGQTVPTCYLHNNKEREDLEWEIQKIADALFGVKIFHKEGIKNT